MAKLTEKQVISALARLAKGWPGGFWLFSAAGTLYLMRKNESGERPTYGEGGGVDQDYIVTSFPGIENDGGDW